MSAPSNKDDPIMQASNWGPQDDQAMGPGGNVPSVNGTTLPVDDRNTGQDSENADYPRGSSVGDASVSNSKDAYREKQVKPNKVYIGGLPEHTRQEDLQTCFGEIGAIVNIELKVGYGFVEFDSREAAEKSVSMYHEGHFMGNKIRVELSHGGGRTAKYSGDPGACFKCGLMGHWARECPNNATSGPHRRSHYDSNAPDRGHRDFSHPPRNLPPRDDFGPPRYGPPREARYEYPPPIPRDHRRPPSPRGVRDYPPVVHDRPREYDDYRRGPPAHDRDRYVPPAEMRGRYGPPPEPAYRGYNGPPQHQPPPPAVPVYDRYDRRPHERYPSSYPPPVGSRARTPPRVREEFERQLPPREYHEFRGRPISPPPPPRYPTDYPRMNMDSSVPRYRRRSESPVRAPGPYDTYAKNGYAANPAPPSVSSRREYPPRNARDTIDPVGGYRRP